MKSPTSCITNTAWATTPTTRVGTESSARSRFPRSRRDIRSSRAKATTRTRRPRDRRPRAFRSLLRGGGFGLAHHFFPFALASGHHGVNVFLQQKSLLDQSGCRRAEFLHVLI